MNARRVAVIVAVVATVAVAGCLDDGGTETPGENDTEELAYPPGVNGSGIQDLDALYDAHTEVLGTAYRENTSDYAATANGSRRIVRDVRRGPDGAIAVHATQYVDGRPVRVQETWDDAEHDSRLVRAAEPGAGPRAGTFRREYRNENVSNYYEDQMRQAVRLLRSYVGDADQQVRRVDDERLWNVTVEDGSVGFTLHVTPDGHVRWFRLRDPSSEWTIATEPIDRLEEPVWLDDAEQRAPPADGPWSGNESTRNGTNVTDAAGDDPAANGTDATDIAGDGPAANETDAASDGPATNETDDDGSAGSAGGDETV